MHIGLLFAALLPWPALGLRAKPKDDWSDLDDDSPAGLPKLEDFDTSWREMMRLEPAEVVPVSGVQLVLGVFTTAKEAQYRRVIRQTWMNRPGVCKASQGPQANCSVYVGFVQGVPAVVDGEGDVVTLPIDENMNNGKSFEFFRDMLQVCPWATHYAKMDSDVFPHLTVILKSMPGRPGCESYLGRPWSCTGKDCPAASCGPPVEGNFLRYQGFSPEGRCWSYMQGGLYILSRGLLLSAMEPGSYWKYHTVGFEDVTTGRAVAEVAWTKGLCVETWTGALPLKHAYFHYHSGNQELHPQRISPAWEQFYA